MVHLQIVSRDGPGLQAALRSAIAERHITSFEFKRVNGRLRLRHVRYAGDIKLESTTGPLLVTMNCRDRTKEWQLLSAFIGRLADHFKDQISSINIQLEPDQDQAARPKAARAQRAHRKAPRTKRARPGASRRKPARAKPRSRRRSAPRRKR